MTDMTSFWDDMCPFLDYLEDTLGMNTRNLVPLYQFMKSPVLVIGAGQGLS